MALARCISPDLLRPSGERGRQYAGAGDRGALGTGTASSLVATVGAVHRTLSNDVAQDAGTPAANEDARDLSELGAHVPSLRHSQRDRLADSTGELKTHLPLPSVPMMTLPPPACACTLTFSSSSATKVQVR